MFDDDNTNIKKEGKISGQFSLLPLFPPPPKKKKNYFAVNKNPSSFPIGINKMRRRRRKKTRACAHARM